MWVFIHACFNYKIYLLVSFSRRISCSFNKAIVSSACFAFCLSTFKILSEIGILKLKAKHRGQNRISIGWYLIMMTVDLICCGLM